MYYRSNSETVLIADLEEYFIDINELRLHLNCASWMESGMPCCSCHMPQSFKVWLDDERAIRHIQYHSSVLHSRNPQGAIEAFYDVLL
jgi:hypothetical protein